MDQDQLKHNVKSPSIWIRLVYMLLFAFAIYISMMAFWCVVIAQFLFVLFSGERNPNIAKFADVVCQYIGQCLGFLSFATEEKPFPFDDFPDSRIDNTVTDQRNS
jgi:hypothetical protein